MLSAELKNLNRKLSQLSTAVSSKKKKNKRRTNRPKMRAKGGQYGNAMVTHVEQPNGGYVQSVASSLANSGIQMSAGARDYCRAIVDPHQVYESVYVPRPLAIHTQKISLRATFQAVVGSDGNGFVALTPNMLGPGTRDFAVYSSSSTTSYGTTFDRASTAQTGFSAVTMPFPYSVNTAESGNFGNTPLDYCLVCAGIRIRPINPVLDRSGIMVSYSSTRNEDLDGYTITKMAQMREAKTVVATAEGAISEVVVYGRHEAEFQLSDALRPPAGYLTGKPYSYNVPNGTYWDYTSSNTEGASAVGLIMISGAKAGAVYQCELVLHAEYAGRSVNMISTPCYPDPVGIQTAHSIANQIAVQHAATYATTTRSHHAPSAISTVAVNMGPVAAREMMKSKNPRMVAAGEGLLLLNKVIPKSEQARGLDAVGHAMGNIFRRRR